MNPYGSGRIAEIIDYLLKRHKVTSVDRITTQDKLLTLCDVLKVSPQSFDKIIAGNSQVLRTIKGHAFEVVFDLLLTNSGYICEKAGGDQDFDRIVNSKTLQLKTPHMAGSRRGLVEYKTHKTHGAKSVLESSDYYHSIHTFSDFLIGLVSYDPINILVLNRDELPRHPKFKDRIPSPFAIAWESHRAVNAFSRLGLKTLDLQIAKTVKPKRGRELLPLTAAELDLTTDVILNTILCRENFRIWDMNIRGFTRECSIFDLLDKKGIARPTPLSLGKKRGDKADFALFSIKENKYEYLQSKGITYKQSGFQGEDSYLCIETQLTRGRVNDHPTQSRLYLRSDFDILLLPLDPCYSYEYMKNVGLAPILAWQHYAIPTKDLNSHPKWPHRLKSMQVRRYLDIQPYRIDENWFKNWRRV